jgi:hypothetical protein
MHDMAEGARTDLYDHASLGKTVTQHQDKPLSITSLEKRAWKTSFWRHGFHLSFRETQP